MQVDRVQHRAPHVVLALVVRAVADPDRPCALVAVEVVERSFDELPLAADAVHDLELVRPPADVGDEVQEVVGLPVEAERVQPPQRECRVAEPGVAVVPVPLAAGRLGQRGRRRGDDRPGRRVGQALERERRALQVLPPGVVGEAPAGQPVLPVMSRPDQALVGVVERRGAARRSPHDSAQNRLSPSLRSVRAIARGPSNPRLHVAREGQRHVAAAGRAGHLVVALAGVLPAAEAAGRSRTPARNRPRAASRR